MSHDPTETPAQSDQAKISSDNSADQVQQQESPAEHNAANESGNDEQQSTPVQDQANTESSANQHQQPENIVENPVAGDKSKKPIASSIRIGTQRDPANKQLAPSEPKAVREAKTSPIYIPILPPKTEIPESAEDAENPPAPQVTIDQLSGQWEQDAGEFDQINMDQLLDSQPDKEIADEIELESRVKGTVTKIHKDDVFFLLKGHLQGVASLRQFKKAPEPGAMMDVIVNRYSTDDSLYEVSIPGASVSIADWSDITEGAVVEAKITGSNTGGLECMVNHIRGFIPASQISKFRVENLGEFVNQKLQCVVTEANPSRRNLVLSHRAIMERESEEKRKELMETLEVGHVCDGIVTKLMDFGAFVDIGGVEGLVHISKLAWDRVQHPKDILEVGQKIKVKIDKIAPESGKISLSHRDTLEHPWEGIETKYPTGTTVKGAVSRIANFGAFVKLESGIEGLIHISELAHYRVQNVKSVVNEGDEVEVKVLSVDRDAQKIGLSLKETQPKPEPKESEKPAKEVVEEARPLAVPKRKKPLKGGTSGDSGGDQFGLKW